MADKSRRRFLKGSAGVVAGAAIGGCAQDTPPPDTEPQGVDPALLGALAMLVLPRGALGDAGIERVTGQFVGWLDGFEPVAELNHPYYSEEVDYGPPDPAPLWGAQLEALDIEAQQRFGQAFPELGAEQQRYVLERQLPANLPQALPYAGDAPHIAIGLIAYLYATSEANDLCLEAQVGRQTCRGLASSPDKPAPLGD